MNRLCFGIHDEEQSRDSELKRRGFESCQTFDLQRFAAQKKFATHKYY
jgi:hypothetical protein